MLMRKTWNVYWKCGTLKHRYCGYFLFGFIPLYISRD